jgi:hypothetical protein
MRPWRPIAFGCAACAGVVAALRSMIRISKSQNGFRNLDKKKLAISGEAAGRYHMCVQYKNLARSAVVFVSRLPITSIATPVSAAAAEQQQDYDDNQEQFHCNLRC